jgi:hypothetical protein
MRVVAKRQQTCHISIGLKPNRTTVATIATVWAAVHYRPFATKTDAATTAVTSANI